MRFAVFMTTLAGSALLGVGVGCQSGSEKDRSNTAPGTHSQNSGCRTEALPAFEAFVQGESNSLQRFPGRITAISSVLESRFQDVSISDLEKTAVIRLTGIADGLPFDVGSEVKVHLEYAPGFPSDTGFVVEDGHGLLFAGVSDQSVGGRVLVDGIDGFRVKLVESDCGNRATSSCYDSIVNLQLSVSFGGQEARLFPGESARLGGYEVHCRIAQVIEYSSRCADAGLHGVSYTIRRSS